MKPLRLASLLPVLAFIVATSLIAAGQVPRTKFASAVAYAEGVGPDSVSAADLGGNGVLDLVVANFCEIEGEAGNCEGGVSVLLGNGNGTFQAPVTYGTGAYQATSVAVGDVNGDDIPDLIVANTCGTLGQYGCDSQPGAVS